LHAIWIAQCSLISAMCFPVSLLASTVAYRAMSRAPKECWRTDDNRLQLLASFSLMPSTPVPLRHFIYLFIRYVIVHRVQQR